MNKYLQDLGDYLKNALPGVVETITEDQSQLIVVCEQTGIASFLTFLRDDSNCLFKVLLDICGVDYPEREKRFEVVYHLQSLRLNQRIRIKVMCGEGDIIPSVSGVFSSANWYERETYDFFGIMFSDHPDLRRLLTDYGFDGHPLRKDFPLTGYVEVRYDEEQKRVVYEPVKLTQAFRSFDFMSPWEGAEYILPGDEKADDATRGGK
jgi:NADH-quinone oxidoreductase subunit C